MPLAVAAEILVNPLGGQPLLDFGQNRLAERLALASRPRGSRLTLRMSRARSAGCWRVLLKSRQSRSASRQVREPEGSAKWPVLKSRSRSAGLAGFAPSDCCDTYFPTVSRSTPSSAQSAVGTSLAQITIESTLQVPR